MKGSKIQDAIANMILRNDFWGYVLNRIPRVPDVTVPIMGVGVKNRCIHLFYNPVTVDMVKQQEVEFILEHEGLHVLHQHMIRELFVDVNRKLDRAKHTKLNIAMDYAINSIIKDMPKVINLEGYEFKPCFPDAEGLPSGKSMEWYYDNTKQDFSQCEACGGIKYTGEPLQGQQPPDNGCGNGHEQDDNNKGESQGGCGDCQGGDTDDNTGNSAGGNSNGPGNQNNGQNGNPNMTVPGLHKCPDCGGQVYVSNHDKWLDIPEEIRRRVEAETRSIFSDAFKDLVKNRGTIPDGCEQILKELLSDPKLNYIELIRRWVRGQMLNGYKRSLNRVSKKRAHLIGHKTISPFPGRVQDKKFKINICIDTSGSMSMEEMTEALKAIQNIVGKDHGTIINVIEVDAEVQREYRVKKTTDIQLSFKGRGGTTLEPGLIAARENNADCTLFFTDGGCENMKMVSKSSFPKNLLWLLTSKDMSSIEGTAPIIVLGDL